MGEGGAPISKDAGDWRLYVMGWIAYSDDLKIPRRTAFCCENRVASGSKGRFCIVDDNDYAHKE
jgi:hypothetical protein